MDRILNTMFPPNMESAIVMNMQRIFQRII